VFAKNAELAICDEAYQGSHGGVSQRNAAVAVAAVVVVTTGAAMMRLMSG
jgi:hypothetical protein